MQCKTYSITLNLSAVSDLPFGGWFHCWHKPPPENIKWWYDNSLFINYWHFRLGMKINIIQYNFLVYKTIDISVVDSPVLAKVDQYAEIEYSMVGSPVISNTSIDLGLKVTLSITVWYIFFETLEKITEFRCLSKFLGWILQHWTTQGTPLFPNTFLIAVSGHRYAIHRSICLHHQLSRLCVQQSWCPPPLHHWWHGKMNEMWSVTQIWKFNRCTIAVFFDRLSGSDFMILAHNHYSLSYKFKNKH